MRWLFGLGFGLNSATYFGRQYVNWRRFSKKALRRSDVSVLNLLLRISGLMAVQVFLLLLHASLSPAVVSYRSLPWDPSLTFLVCPVLDFSPFDLLWLSYQTLVLFWGLFYASVLRTTELSAGMTGAAISALILGLLFALLTAFLDPTTPLSFWLFSLNGVALVLTPLLWVVVPKFIAIRRKQSGRLTFELEQLPPRVPESADEANEIDGSPAVQPKNTSSPTPSVLVDETDTPRESHNVAELLATIQRKENEIALLQNKLLKRQYRIKSLKKRLGEEEFDQ